ncbi:lipoprotein insertase outer membrane protein LolB [Hydrogenophaga sp.]|uniref:lipoprotein insertase outer membrane protein LolB n=1 Tax=Hydrogenophaga sp. TaxID=1904254 RepID=UPI0019A14E3B|nr:lipoprotein insertase outer membrane protein LolB [Hydrogenophaga sp.]MBD3892894.1 outer membrane lipoprotein LolB [Hydrogenophaga sp.]
MKRLCWLALLCLPLLLLVGCATPQRTSEPHSSLPAAPYWSGRLALQVHSDPPQSFSAAFDLSGSAQNGELLLSSALGQTLASVRWSEHGVELRQGDRLTLYPNLEDLATGLGASGLPLAALFEWLQGRAQQSLDWQVDLTRHAEGRLVARRSSPLPTAELRIVFQP